MAWSTPSTRSTGDLITAAIWNQDVVSNPIALLPASLSFLIDGGGAVIATGEKGHIEIPFKCDITRQTTLADQTGSIVIDIWKRVYADFPPTVTQTITASAKPTISSGIKDQDSTLTGWTTACAAGDILGYNVDSCTTIERCTIALLVSRS